MRAKYGMLAGLTATILISVLMLAEMASGLLPQLDIIGMLAELSARFGRLPDTPVIGWLLHFLIGAVLWGIAFALTAHLWPFSSFVLKGIGFAILAWLLMMLLFMPLAAAGLFGLNLGMSAPIATLIPHLVYGAALGGVYRWLAGRDPRVMRAHYRLAQRSYGP